MQAIVKTLLLSLTITTLTLTTACGNSENNVDKGNREGILHWGNGAEPQELDPHIVTGVPEHHIIVALLEGLVIKDAKTLEPGPAVAQSWQISDDGTIYTFNIRPTARWSNGDKMTADDFVWSWQRALTPALGNAYAYMYNPLFDSMEGELPHVVGRARFGRIAVANSDAGARASIDAAIAEAHRAVGELMG